MSVRRPPEEAVILAGGLGTRLRSVVDDRPKPMAPVGGRPFLSWLLEAAAAQGVRRVVLSVGYRREAIQDYFGHRHGGVEIAYAVEDEPLGTGGALRLALDRVEGAETLVLNGDTYQEIDFAELAACRARAPDAALAVALRIVPDAVRYGRAVVENGRLRAFRAAGQPGPGLVNAGVYLVPRDLFDGVALPARFSFEGDFLEPGIERLAPAVYLAEGMFIDIGIPSAFREAQTLIPRRASGMVRTANVSAG